MRTFNLLFFLALLAMNAQGFAQNKCLKLNGLNASVTVPDLDLGRTNTLSIEANVYSSATQKSWTGIFTFKKFRSGLILRENNELGYMWEDSNGERYTWASGLFLKNNQWTHLAMVVNANEVRLYVDKQKAVHAKRCDAKELGTAIIGADAAQSGRNFNGLMAEIRIWKTARSESQMTTATCELTPETENELAGYYSCKKEDPKWLIDSKNNKNGTLRNVTYGLYRNKNCLPSKYIEPYFSLDKTEVVVGEKLTVTDESYYADDVKIKLHKWTFAGATPSTGKAKETAIKYHQAGNYPIFLSVKGEDNNTIACRKQITVIPAPELDKSSWITTSLTAPTKPDYFAQMIDNNLNTYCILPTDNDTVQTYTIIVDMNLYAEINGVAFQTPNRGSQSKQNVRCQVSISDDAVKWTKATTENNICTADNEKRISTFPSKIIGRYIRLELDIPEKDTGKKPIELSEFYAYGSYTGALSFANDSIELSTLLKKLTPVYDAPSWSDTKTTPNGPIMGNGDMHVILLGDRHKQTFHISQSEMWSDKGGKFSTTGYRCIPTGGINIYPLNTENKAVFNQEMDFQQAKTSATSSAGFKTETFVCATENVMVTKLWTDGKTAIPIAVDVWCKADAADLPSSAGINRLKATLWATRSSYAGPSARWATRNAIASTIQGVETKLWTDSLGKSTASFILEPGKTIEIRTVLKGGKGATSHLNNAVNRVSALTADSIETLRNKHKLWWNNFWFHHSYVITNDKKLDKFYYGALYQFACINRREFLPAAQHPFCISDDPAWQGDYHMNQELMGQNCGFFTANRPELSDGAHQILLDYINSGRDIAANKMTSIHPTFTSHKGICYNVGLGPWGINTDNYFGGQVSNASWAGSLIIWNYYFNKDTTWLRNTGYEYIKALADFWVSHLGEKVNGKYVDYGAGQEEYFGKNPCTDLGLIRHVLKAAIECSTDLGVDTDQHAIWQDILNNLSDYPTYQYGDKTIFQSYDGWNSFDQRGAYSCLEQVWPGEAINLSSSLTLRQTTHNTLDLCDYWIGPKMAIYGARTGYPIEKNILKLKTDLIDLKPGMWEGLRQNGTIGGLRVNGEFIEFIHTSFLQSQEDFIRIFPAWYKNKPAKFRGLKTKGAFIVDANLDAKGNVILAKITSTKGGKCSVLNIYPGYKMYVMENGIEISSNNTNNISTFDTKEGSIYTFGKRK